MADKTAFFEKYEKTELLGKGAMGEVYLGWQKDLDRIVAIKTMKRELAERDEFIQRFRREAKIVARLNHPNIVQIHDFWELEDGFYIVMEFVKGQPLGSVLRERRKLRLAEALDLMAQVARGLHCAHEQDVVHRDIKPDNVMLTETGQAKVTDFGVAHLAEQDTQFTQVGATIGTPLYMSPEQAIGGEVDGRSDIYAMGILLFQLLTGTVPFQAKTSVALARKHEQEPPPSPRSFDPAIPPLLEAGILKALAKKKQDRFQTAEEFACFLESPEVRKPFSSKQEAELHQAATMMEELPTIEGPMATAQDRQEQSQAATALEAAPSPVAEEKPTGAPPPPTPASALPAGLTGRDWAVSAVLFLLGLALAAWIWMH